MAKFTVDTHLFRELGELLVGRDSTALVELIKNAYDADATEVVVYGSDLADKENGFIRIADDGIGMDPTEFVNGFLRIASRIKEAGERRSLRFHRRYTGAKGIGRLAAHKLARAIEVVSFPSHRESPNSEAIGVDARIDWDLVESFETLDQLEGTQAIVVTDVPTPRVNGFRTTITLRKLRRHWTKHEHGRFLDEVQTFGVPSVLSVPLPSTIVRGKLLFDYPLIRDVANKAGAAFSVKLEGDLAPPDDFWQAALAAADWIVEIDADESTKVVHYAIAPTERTKADLPTAKREAYSLEHPTPAAGPFFQARILVRTGQLSQARAARSWLGSATGVRVFMEGFRVLPYGDARNDWLSLDKDTAGRARGLLSRPEADPLSELLPEGESIEDEGLSHLPNKHYFGAVFLTEQRARALRLLVNREGFVPDEGYETLVTLIRGGIDLATRIRASATVAQRAERRAQRGSRTKPRSASGSSEYMPTALTIRSSVAEAQAQAQDAKGLLAKGDMRGASAKVDSAIALVAEVAGVSDDLVREGAMLRVLASVGTQLTSFVHEINSLLGMAQALENAVARLRKELKLRPEQRHLLGEFGKAAADLRRSLERQASYLVDVVTPDAKRRRSRQGLAERFDSASRIVASAAERRDVVIQNGIPGDLRSPPMFPAELTTVFANLLTNAVKAAGKSGRVRATGSKRRSGGAVVRVENTGVAVRLAEAERWFRLFESSTVKTDPILGQGMGLGLPITRSILEEYGASVEFVEPKPEFATAIQLEFPE